MEDENKKKTEEENKKRLLLALGLLFLGSYKKEDLEKISDFSSLDEKVQEKAEEIFKKYDLQKYTDNPDHLSKEQILDITAKTQSAEDGTQYFKIISIGDDKVCEYCKEWNGKTVTLNGEDPRYPRLFEFLNSNGAHFGCRCNLRPVKCRNFSNKDLENLAMNTDILKDTQVYRGFVDENYDKDIDYEFDETLVMITPLGEFFGSSTDGKPIKEIVDEESVKAMALQTEEILLDRDHASMRPAGDRDTEAMGWISGLKAITHLGSMSGLYGIIKWAGKGIDLVKDRAYRFLSPVFQLDENGRAVRLLNVALTNRPALKMPPILNSKTEENNISITQTEKENSEMNMTKEEIVSLIKETLAEIETEKTENSCQDKTEEAQNTEHVDEKPVEEEKKEEKPVEEKPVEEEKKEEVIKEEALNSAPTIGCDISGKSEWENLHGEAFFAWLKKNK